ncbi:hypothetical protein XCV2910 [Xanthomonas euvesicatoria pv. vesicatoria str. 85-10]|uniref:Uncharacterized protein n=1 Tax=Xanthomonas euvesicatoria pv. vesicatoria (strain 85-10) TaxID=316273 RepID=Q3BRH2_XANE5|nr:hypothetical protein XCV2910 [Xanthomonas euvesicatoria pv. vesicatoria str. 85-10]
MCLWVLSDDAGQCASGDLAMTLLTLACEFQGIRHSLMDSNGNEGCAGRCS